MLYTEGSRLLRRYDEELLCIEPWGRNSLRVRASRYKFLCRILIVYPLCFRLYAVQVKDGGKILFLLEIGYFIVSVAKQRQRRRLHSAYIQGFAVQQRKKARRIDTHQPIRP